ncbi:hypothetical protein [Sporolactobacillus inulinus]|jgi:hypothetical protein|uniref:Uncharacterized protein n=1 Tax=Sporolactobacillus inulinus TaxID=2078 RepID=A0A4Y1ZE62_9BACL|nr:hypothetical protein [Sporolactobacillus inulinus]GAY77456.1 hypothetical protein NBRC111894_3010 [Sporolactobacillus inulinus]GEB78505.1 hypothetical protein SIN01_28500 [Sporolactobacillus inulinus]
MNSRFAIYEEFDGSRPLPVSIRLPQKIVEAASIRDAVNAFSMRHNLDIIRYEELPEDDVRVLFRRTNAFGQRADFGYYFRKLRFGELIEQP